MFVLIFLVGFLFLTCVICRADTLKITLFPLGGPNAEAQNDVEEKDTISPNGSMIVSLVTTL